MKCLDASAKLCFMITEKMLLHIVGLLAQWVDYGADNAKVMSLSLTQTKLLFTFVTQASH